MNISVWHYTGLGLILPAKTGFVFEAQTGGMACAARQQEGVFIPLPASDATSELVRRFHTFGKPLSKKDADFIDGILKACGYEFIAVDRMRSSEVFEAWVPVAVRKPSKRNRWRAPWGATVVGPAILILPNSD